MGQAIITRRLAVGPLYSFENFIFTNAGVTGRDGPNLTQIRNAYSSESWTQNNNFLSMTNQGIQEWTVPDDGIYEIEAWGAQGGHAVTTNRTGGPNRAGGRGARIRGRIPLTKGEVINILVGQEGHGRNNTSTHNAPAFSERAGGGGGTFVWKKQNNLPLIIAGGGGAASGDPSDGQVGRDANTGTSGLGPVSGSGTGGVNGNGGASSGGSSSAGAGAGFLTNGTGPAAGRNGFSPLSATTPGRGGASTSGYVYHGGFGGGGTDQYSNTTVDDSEGTGGGGGYSGGSGGNTSSDSAGGGGGSFIINTATNVATSNGSFNRTGSEPHPAYTGSVSNLNAWNAGHGRVIITKL